MIMSAFLLIVDKLDQSWRHFLLKLWILDSKTSVSMMRNKRWSKISWFYSFYRLNLFAGVCYWFRRLAFVFDWIAKVIVYKNEFLILSNDTSLSSNVFKSLLLVRVLIRGRFIRWCLYIGRWLLLMCILRRMFQRLKHYGLV